MAMSDLTDAERLLASAQNFVQGPIPSGISDLESLADLLQQQTDELRPVAVQLESDVDRYGPFANIVSILLLRKISRETLVLFNEFGQV